MSAAAETVLRRVRNVLGISGLKRLDPVAARLVPAQLLYDGHGVPDWHRQAACREHDTQLFFPEPGEDDEGLTAKRICAGCPVRDQCLTDVMAWEQPSARYGIVGGLSVNERHQRHRVTHRSSRGGEAA